MIPTEKTPAPSQLSRDRHGSCWQGLLVTLGSVVAVALGASPALAQTALTNDGVVEATLSAPAEEDRYTFQATAGEAVHLRVTDTSGTNLFPQLRVLKPDGTQAGVASGDSVASVICSTIESCRLDQTGTYTVVVTDRSARDATGTYELRYAKVPGSDELGELENDSVVTQTLTRGDFDTFTFDAVSGEAIHLTVNDTSGTDLFPRIYLYRPDGTRAALASSDNVASLICSTVESCRLTQTGTYTVVVFDVSSGNDASGSYELRYAKFPSSSELGELETDETITQTLTRGDFDTFTFDANAGEAIHLTVNDTSGTDLFPRVYLYRPDGTRAALVQGDNVASLICSTVESCRLNQTGTYTVAVFDISSGNDASGSYELRYAKFPSSSELGELETDETITQTLTRGDFDTFTFDANAGEAIHLTVNDTSGTDFFPRVYLYRPDGTRAALVQGDNVASLICSTVESCRLNQTGTYTVAVFDVSSGNDATGSYELRYAKLPSSNELGELENDATVTQTLTRGDFDTFTFDANAGEAIHLTVNDTSGTDFFPRIYLYRPDGTRAALVQGDNVASLICSTVESCRLNQSGTYTVVVFDVSSGNDATGSYELRYAKLPSSNELGELENDATVTQTLTRGDFDTFTFDANAGDAIHLRATDTSGTDLFLRIYLYRPDGTRAALVQGDNVAALICSTVESCRLNETGTYTVVVFDVSSGNDALGDYELRFARIPGSDELGRLSNNRTRMDEITLGDVDTFTFEATAGDSATISVRDTSGTDLFLRAGLYRPDGTRTSLATSDSSAELQCGDRLSCRLDQSGIYTLVVTDISSGSDATGKYEIVFNGPVQPDPDPNNPPVLATIGPQMAQIGSELSVTLTATDPNGDTLTFSAAGLPNGASLVQDDATSATFRWTPAEGQAGTSRVTFSVSDGRTPPLSDSEPVNIDVAGGNQAPELFGLSEQPASVDERVAFLVTARDLDGDTLAITADSLPNGAELTDNGNGTANFSWIPTDADRGPNTLDLTVTDDGTPPLSSTGSVTVRVGGNRAPILDPIGAQDGSEGELLEFEVTATDPDGDAVEFSLGNAPTGASLTDNGDGSATFTWTPSFSHAGNASVLFVVNDDGTPMRGDDETVVITVEDVNRPPTIDPVANVNVPPGELVEIALSANDEDGDALTFSLSNAPTGATLDDAGDGTAVFRWTPTIGQADTSNEVTFIVTDDGTATASASTSANITVGTPPNGGRPELSPIGSRTGAEGDPLRIVVMATDADEGDTLRFEVGPLPEGARFDDNGDGTGEILWTPDFDQQGNYDVLVTVFDDGVPSLSDFEEVMISIDTNRPPVLTGVGNRATGVGDDFTLNLNASDPDGDEVGFTIAPDSLPDNLRLTDNGDGTAMLEWLPVDGPDTTYTITVTAFEVASEGLEDPETFNLTVGPGPRPPELGPLADQSVSEGGLVRFTVTASDPDGDAVSCTVGELPPGASFTSSSVDGCGTFEWQTEDGDAGVYNVTFTATDDSTAALSASAPATIEVLEVVTPSPSLGPVAGATVNEGDSLSIPVAGSDPLDRELVLRASNLPGGATFTDNGDGTGALEWTPGFGDRGTYDVVIVVEVSGNPVLSDSGTATLTVNSVAARCDVDLSGVVDRDDIRAIFAARGTVVPTGESNPLDIDGNGIVTVNDARGCTIECTEDRCIVRRAASPLGEYSQ